MDRYDINPPQAYQGEQDYIFVSYSHKESEMVWPIIDGLKKKGYRIWYDDGIDPGTEWDKNIAEHIMHCSVFVAILSYNYLNSKNCKDELNYSRELDKKQLIIYLDELSLPPEIQMRIGRIQAVHKKHYKDSESFYAKISKTDGIDCCKNDFLNAENDDEYIGDEICPFPETRNIKLKLQPMTSLCIDYGTIKCNGETVEISVRQGDLRQECVNDVLEYIKLVSWFNTILSRLEKIKVRSIWWDAPHPSVVINIEYLYDKSIEPFYTVDKLKEMLHDGWELRCGIVYTVLIRQTKVDMNSDYYYENDPKFYTNDDYR